MTTLFLTIFFAVIVAISAVVGLVRGLNKSVIRLVTLVLAAILTFVVAGPVTTLVAQNVLIEGQTVGEILLEGLRSKEIIASILDAAPLMQEAILVAPAFVMAILIFPVAFFLLSFVTWIVFLFVQKPLRKLIFKDSCNKEEAAQRPVGVRVGTRFAGMGVGIVTGVLIFAMIMTPMLGFFTTLPEKSTMDEALDAMIEQNSLSAADAEILRDAYAVTDSPLVNICAMIGLSSAGREYINSVSQIEADGQQVCLADELGSLMKTVQTAMKGGLVNALLSSDDPNALYPILSDKDLMDALMQDMFQSKLLRSAVPEVMAMAMESVASGMNVPANKEVVYNNMMDDIAVAVKDAQINYAGIKAYEQANSVAHTFARLRAPEQPETGALMTQEEYEAEIQKLVELVETISSILNTAISGDNKAFTDSIADHIVNEVSTQAAENGEDALANFDATSVQSAISNIDAESVDAGEGDATQLLEQLTDQEKFETDVATVETITEAIRESVKNAVADDSQAAETASTLASVVADFASAVSSATNENGEMDATKLDYDKLASAVTTLQNSNLKDVGSSVLDMAVSGDLGNNELVSGALGAMKEGYENGEDVGSAISSTGALINLGAAMDGGENGEADQEAMVNSLTSLINNLSDYTIGLLPSIMSTDTLTSMGIPKEHADAAYDVVETLLKELMKLKGAADYDSEVNAILSMYNLATSGMDSFTKEDIPELADYARKSDAIFNTLMSVSTSNPFGVEINNEDTRNDLVKAIEDGYADSTKTQKDLDIYNAIASLLGLDEDVNLG